MITDEMVEKAWKSYEKAVGYELVYERHGVVGMRAALEAIAPLLIAQGFNEALELAEEYEDLGVDDYERAMNQLINTLRVRMQELDPK